MNDDGLSAALADLHHLYYRLCKIDGTTPTDDTTDLARSVLAPAVDRLEAYRAATEGLVATLRNENAHLRELAKDKPAAATPPADYGDELACVRLARDKLNVRVRELEQALDSKAKDYEVERSVNDALLKERDKLRAEVEAWKQNYDDQGAELARLRGAAEDWKSACNRNADLYHKAKEEVKSWQKTAQENAESCDELKRDRDYQANAARAWQEKSSALECEVARLAEDRANDIQAATAKAAREEHSRMEGMVLHACAESRKLHGELESAKKAHAEALDRVDKLMAQKANLTRSANDLGQRNRDLRAALVKVGYNAELAMRAACKAMEETPLFPSEGKANAGTA
jgi:chromosome segregation ATPase